VLAGGGAGLGVLVLSWWPAALVIIVFRDVVNPVAGFVGLGVTCGLAAGYAAAAFSNGSSRRLAVGAWSVWSLGIATLVITQLTPTAFGWVTLPAGLVGAVLAATARNRKRSGRTPKGLLARLLLGAFAAYAVLTLGVGMLGTASSLGLRPTGVTVDYYVNVYLRNAGTALWVVIALATALAAVLPLALAGFNIRNSATVMALSVILFVAFTGLSAFTFDFYVACTVGTPLAPFAWVTHAAQC